MTVKGSPSLPLRGAPPSIPLLRLCYETAEKLYNVVGSLYNRNIQQESNNARPPKKNKQKKFENVLDFLLLTLYNRYISKNAYEKH